MPVVVTLLTGDRVRLTSPSDAEHDAGRGADRGRADHTPGVTITPGPGREGITFSTRYSGEHIYVVPSDAIRPLAAGRLDPRLFDVAGLVEDGYADHAAKAVPLIVRGRKLTSPKGATVRRELPGIRAVAVSEPKQTATTYWRWLLGSNVEKVWLDGRVRGSLDQSVPQTGAPVAWEHGLTGEGVKVAVLDTGIDTTHADLSDAVTAERDFTGSATGPADKHGHGTHVASTITGSGAADGGTYKGMAPDAALLNAKVLDDDGFGTESGVIAGAEWAIGQGAKVLNLSIGGDISDGNDPLSLAVNELSAASDALFVVAAGNDGGAGTINSPGAADAALTVGAVDRDGATAWFSSRGPRYGDGVLKPDIAAPGVDIVAAKAAGSTRGAPVGEFYQRLSGTSMATPHVAGAAAILAQQHPDWDGERLKAALASTAKPEAGVSVYEQGSGQLDVARAVSQPVVADQSSLSVLVKWPYPAQPITRTLTYRNFGGADVTLELAAELSGTAPEGYVTFSPTALTVPAGGEASVTVTVDPSRGTPNTSYPGLLTATGSGVAVSTPLSIVQEEESYDVTVRLIDRAGRVIDDPGDPALLTSVLLEGLDDLRYVGLFAGDGYLRARVPRGLYMLAEGVRSPDDSVTLLSEPDLLVDRDLSITLDAREANPADVTVDKPGVTPGRAVIGVLQEHPDPEYYIAGTLLYVEQADQLYALETEPVTDRAMLFYYRQMLNFAGGRYDLLAGQEDQVPASPSYSFDDSDLARLDLDFSNPGVPHGGLWYLRTYLPSPLDLGVSVEHEFEVPGPYTVFVNPKLQNGETAQWQDWFTARPVPEDPWGSVYYYESTNRYPEFQPGQRMSIPYGKGAFSAGMAGTWWGDGSGVVTPQELVPGGGTWLRPSQHTVGSGTIWRNGQVIGEYDLERDGYFIPPELSGESAKYTVEYTNEPNFLSDVTTYGKQIHGRWSFTAKDPGAYGPMTLLNARLTGPFDRLGRATAGARFPLTLMAGTGKSPAPNLVWASLALSYDDGRTWRNVPLRKTANGTWTASVTHPASHNGFVSTRIAARDDQGRSADFTMIRSYGLVDP